LLDALEEFRRDLPNKSREVRRREGLALIDRCTELLGRIEAQCAALQ
jgi:hypothetical protein